jgi:hypothetical protein
MFSAIAAGLTEILGQPFDVREQGPHIELWGEL